MRKLLLTGTVIMMCAISLTACGGSATQNGGKEDKADNADRNVVAESNISDSDEDLLTGKHNVEIEIEKYGTIKLELDADTAPITVTNFINLANDGFYNGLTFHRIIDGFMMQGGDPNGDGTGGADKEIKGEFANNGVSNSISHVKGTISMARATDPDSASSQFFICQADSTFLDGDYAAFGHVTEGIEIVDKICEELNSDNPITGGVDADKQPVITAINVLD